MIDSPAHKFSLVEYLPQFNALFSEQSSTPLAEKGYKYPNVKAFTDEFIEHADDIYLCALLNMVIGANPVTLDRIKHGEIINFKSENVVLHPDHLTDTEPDILGIPMHFPIHLYTSIMLDMIGKQTFGTEFTAIVGMNKDIMPHALDHSLSYWFGYSTWHRWFARWCRSVPPIIEFEPTDYIYCGQIDANTVIGGYLPVNREDEIYSSLLLQYNFISKTHNCYIHPRLLFTTPTGDIMAFIPYTKSEDIRKGGLFPRYHGVLVDNCQTLGSSLILASLEQMLLHSQAVYRTTTSSDPSQLSIKEANGKFYLRLPSTVDCSKNKADWVSLLWGCVEARAFNMPELDSGVEIK